MHNWQDEIYRTAIEQIIYIAKAVDRTMLFIVLCWVCKLKRYLRSDNPQRTTLGVVLQVILDNHLKN
jgi:hypothetical protein